MKKELKPIKRIRSSFVDAEFIYTETNIYFSFESMSFSKNASDEDIDSLMKILSNKRVKINNKKLIKIK